MSSICKSPLALILEDNPGERELMENILQETGFDVDGYAFFEEARDALQSKKYNVFVVDLNIMSKEEIDVDGISFLTLALDKVPHAPVAIISAYLDENYGSRLSKFLFERSTPLNCQIAKPGYSKLKEWAKASFVYLRQKFEGQRTVYHSEDIRVKRLVDDVVPIVAKSGEPVLIIGESGTGKEDLARIIHEDSNNPFRTGPYFGVNCAATNDELILSDLFGHVMGAFTGAHKHRLGWFLEASGWKCEKTTGVEPYIAWLLKCGNEVGYAKKVLFNGGNKINQMGNFYTTVNEDSGEYLYVLNAKPGTLFLDEIGDLSPVAEVALLRALDGYGIRPLGYTGPALLPNCRIIASTNRIRNRADLCESYESIKDIGRMRKDLYWRLACWPLELPPLRERKVADGQYEWVVSLRKWASRDGLHFRENDLEEFANEMAGKELEKLWDGNWRELRYVYARAKTVAEMRPGNKIIRIEDLHFASQWVLVEGYQRNENHTQQEVAVSAEDKKNKVAIEGSLNPEVEERLDSILLIRHVLTKFDIKTSDDDGIKNEISKIDFNTLNLGEQVMRTASDRNLVFNAVKRCKREGRVINPAIDILMGRRSNAALKNWWKNNVKVVIGVVSVRFQKYAVIVPDLQRMSREHFRGVSFKVK